MPPRLSDPLGHLLARIESSPRRVIIGIVGMPGAGKTTLASALAAQVNAVAGAGTAVALGMDGFHLTKAQLAAMPNAAEAFARRGAPWTFDAAGFVSTLAAVRAGAQTVDWPGFEHRIGDPVPAALQVPPAARMVIVEGLYLLHRADGWGAVRPLLDTCWYLDTPPAVAMERLTARHMAAWDFSRAQAVARIAQSDGINAQLVQSTAGDADFWV